jgi:hypothetical protein
LQIETMPREILYDLEAYQIIERVQTPRSTAFGGLGRRTEEILLVPILQWRRLTPTIRLAVLLSKVSMKIRQENENKTVFMKVNRPYRIVNECTSRCAPCSEFIPKKIPVS